MHTHKKCDLVTIAEAAVSSVTIINPPSYVVDGDRNVELQCTVTLSHHIGPDYSALNIRWASDRSIVHNCPHLQPHGNSNTFTCNLTLINVSATSAGVYVCSGEVTGSNVLQTVHNLTVEGQNIYKCWFIGTFFYFELDRFIAEC